DNAPTFNSTSMVACCCICNAKAESVYLPKPAASTASEYRPGGSAVKTYRPATSVAVSWLVLRSASVMMTFACGTADFVECATTPRTDAVNACASAHTCKTRLARTPFVMALIPPPRFETEDSETVTPRHAPSSRWETVWQPGFSPEPFVARLRGMPL